ncbi:MAG: pteridine reductase [gamma proteobacterium symbiont of Bathyaustriella thionipta]|nr:pteridine reductase [gamma proteobacterium symbiont of Bathyaustriella thionipta]MCU7950203.1 pteridine reductase [gamma proteobacterium symbiont of Bathyaustriella thionipta]MCU7953798.1 pteridine reductase [gamma proteobacterium symbiont of Bathyaustriella thionipta]MCU7956745.1 pteridine reductase [gamma proteobacterium symbiont of Bathyaustriella thionipta]MCU7968933.1 pteridine reductase [gamma proteobacterium symbiont of Bathyaustriella thionipta]
MTDKVALITGGVQRVGAMTARLLHAAGANLVLHYRHSRQSALELQAELNDKRNHSVILIQAELLETVKLKGIISKSIEQWGRLDILINNASSFYPTPMGTVTENDWDDLMGSNMKAPFFLSQAAAPHLEKYNGCIINIVDIHAQRPMEGHSVYNMAKAGLAMLVKTLAFELGPKIRVNGVAPGAIMWPAQEMDDLTKQRIVSRTYLKRKGSAEDIAKTVLFLAANADYITGQIIAVDGGRSLYL